MIFFVDESTNRQFLKSAKELPPGSNHSTLDKSFCKLVARTCEVLVVIDARLDDRVMDNPDIKELGALPMLALQFPARRAKNLDLCAR